MSAILETHIAFAEADRAWSCELHRLFDKNAGDVRYTKRGSGDDGTELRRLYDARTAAQTAWHQALDAARSARS